MASSGATVGTAVVKLEFDGKEVKSSLQSVTDEIKKSTKGSDLLSSAFGGIKSAALAAGKAIGATLVAGTAAATAAVVSLGKAALQSYADYEQLVGGVETLFKDSANEIFKYANEAYKTAGLSANQYMEQATSFSARLIQGLGGDTKRAAEMSNVAITDMADNVNKMGSSMESVQMAYQGFAKQNYTMLDNLKLGYGGTASEMARLINDSGVLGKSMKVTSKTVNEVSFDKMIEAIHVVQQNMGITGTTAKEAADTISGSVSSMKASWQNLVTGLADDNADFGALVENFVNSLANVFKNIGSRIKIIAEGIAKLVEALGPVITQMIPEFVNTLLPPIIQAIIQIAVALIPMIPTIIRILVDAIVQNIPLIIEGLKQLAPQLLALIPVLIGAVIQILGALAGEIFKWLGGIAGSIGEAFAGIWKGVCDGAAGAWNAIMGIFGNVAKFFGSVFSAAWSAVKAVFSTGGKIFMGIVDGIANAFRAIVNAIIRGINGVVAIPFNAINGFLDGLRGIDILGVKPFGWVGRINVPQIPQLAQGGYASGATNAIIGEAGKEVVLPLEQNTDNWAGLLAGALAEQFEKQDGVSGRPITVNMTNEINNDMDANDIGRVLMESIRRAA